MVLGQIIGTIGRRWYLVLLGLVATVAIGYVGVSLTPPTYQATGTVLLLPSREQMSRGGQNPFLQLSDLDTPASIVIASLSGDERKTAVAQMSPTASYAVQFDESLRGPAVQVIVSDRSAASALSIMHALLDAVPQTLASLQAGRNVPETAAVGSMPLVVATQAEKSTSDTVRAGVAAVGAGLILTAVFVFAIDGLLSRRGARRARRAQDLEQDPDSDGSDPVEAAEADEQDESSEPDGLSDTEGGEADPDDDASWVDDADLDGSEEPGGPESPAELELPDSEDLASRASRRAN